MLSLLQHLYNPIDQNGESLIFNGGVGVIEKIGDRVVKVQFIEYTGKKKKKVTHIEVKEAELDEMLKNNEQSVQAQFALF